MKTKKRQSGVLVIGPYPPPDHGTSIPFKYLVDFLRQHCTKDVCVVNTQSGDKLHVPLYSPGAIRPFLSITRQVIRSLRVCDVCLIYGSQRFITTVGSFYTLLLTGLFAKDVYIYIQGGAFDLYYHALHPCLKFFVRHCLKRAQRIGVQTQLVYTSLSQELNHVVVIPNWNDTLLLHQPKNATVLDFQNQVVRFVYLGEIRSEKGLRELLESFQRAKNQLHQERISMTLDLFGPTRPDFHHMFEQLLSKYGNAVTYHGYLEHTALLEELRRFSVLVLPTYFPSEGYPGVLIEAMALGLAVVTTCWRAIPEIVTHEETGLLCEPGDVQSLTACLLRVAQDAHLRGTLGQNAQERAKQFDVQVVMPRLCELYNLPLKGLPSWELPEKL